MSNHFHELPQQKGLGTLDSILRITENSKPRSKRQEILSEDQFRSLVLYECARCDRNYHQFSLVQVQLKSGIKKKQLNELVKRIFKRIRATDEAGWLNSQSIGIFLPETSREGAFTFARSVVSNHVYQIYTYPDFQNVDSGVKHQNNNKDNRNAQSRKAGIFPENRQNNDCSGYRHGSNSLPRVSITQNVESIIHSRGLPFWKRAIDLIGASMVLALSSPLFLLMAGYIKVVSRGPILFRQERIGYLGRPFTIYKFRTMKMSADCDLHKNHLKDLIDGDRVLTKLDEEYDGRLIPLAGMIRKSCLDELPQLFNVLKGEMSLVGPRPLLSYEVEEFTIWQRQRMHTVPGMTGLWQVSGKNRLTFSQMMRLDARYSRKANFILDFVIFLKTLPAIAVQIKDSVIGKFVSPKHRLERKNIFVRNRYLSNLVRQLFM